jgi:Leucine-rich repeat (LRR) protein
MCGGTTAPRCPPRSGLLSSRASWIMLSLLRGGSLLGAMTWLVVSSIKSSDTPPQSGSHTQSDVCNLTDTKFCETAFSETAYCEFITNHSYHVAYWANADLHSYGNVIACLISNDKFRYIRDWNMINSSIGTEDVFDIFEALTTGKLENLTQFWISDNQIGDDGMKHFSNVIKPTRKLPKGALASLEWLTLDGNNISPDGMAAFSDALSSGALPTLTLLELYDNEIADDGMVALSAALSYVSKLTILWLSNNNIGDSGMIAFSKAIVDGAVPILDMLTLYNNQIGDDGMIALVDAISNEGLAHLTWLSLFNNKIGDKGMTAFSIALSEGHMANLGMLIVSGNKWGNKTAAELELVCKTRNITLVH